MTINERIIQAVTPVVATCVPDPYAPDVGEAETTYCTFNYSELPDSFGDDEPEVIHYLVQLHFYAPLLGENGESSNTLPTRKTLRRSIYAAGFTYPSVENLTDSVSQHFVFEFEDFDGEV